MSELADEERAILERLAAGQTMSYRGFYGVGAWCWNEDGSTVGDGLGVLFEDGLAARLEGVVITNKGVAAIRSASPCCVIGCPLAAEFGIYGESGRPDDDTYACERHVGALLGTPAGLGSENRSWSVVLLKWQTQ